jgi:hypothetical protein
MNTTELLNAIKRAITVPQYQARFSDLDIIALANEEQEATIVPVILSCREEYFVVRELVPTAVGENKIIIPPRAVGRTLREIDYQIAPGAGTFRLNRIQLESAFSFIDPTVVGTPNAFYMMADAMYMVPTPNITGTLLIWYFLRPNTLVPTSSTGTITSVQATGVTLDLVPSTIVVGSLVDIIDNTPGFQTIYKDLVVSNIAGKVVTITGFSNVGVNPFMILSPAQTTSIIQLPIESQQMLIWAVCVRMLQALAIPDQLAIARQELSNKIKAGTELLSPRVEGSLPKIIQPNNLLRSNNSLTTFFNSPIV